MPLPMHACPVHPPVQADKIAKSASAGGLSTASGDDLADGVNRTVTGVLTSRPASRDIKIDGCVAQQRASLCNAARLARTVQKQDGQPRFEHSSLPGCQCT